MNVRVNFRPEARDEMKAAAHWYEERRQGLGVEFVNCVEQAIARCCLHPERFAVVLRGARRAPVSRFPYSIYFREGGDAILIVAVYHNHRRPTGWHGRTQ